MPGTLQTKISQLTEEFAARILSAVQGASLNELSGIAAFPPPRARVGRPRGRRRAGGTEATVTALLDALRGKRAGLRAEALRAHLGLNKGPFLRGVRAALASKAIKKRGVKRATTYYAK
jgi:hypothetical protein